MFKQFISRPCGRPECATAMHRSGLYRTYGRGHLDQDGHWEFPCRTCAIAADERMDTVIAETRVILAHQGVKPDAIEAYIQSAAWMHNAAWPYSQEVQEALEASRQVQVAELELELVA